MNRIFRPSSEATLFVGKQILISIWRKIRRPTGKVIESLDHGNRVFSRDVTAAMLVSLNEGTAVMLVAPTNPPGIELYSYANVFFCLGWKTCSLITWVKILDKTAVSMIRLVQNESILWFYKETTRWSLQLWTTSVFTYLSVSWSELPLDSAMDLKNPSTAGTAYVMSGLATWWAIIRWLRTWNYWTAKGVTLHNVILILQPKLSCYKYLTACHSCTLASSTHSAWKAFGWGLNSNQNQHSASV